MSPTHALLGLLAGAERYGYDLKRTVDQEFDPFWRIDYAQLYRSLARMARAGWVRVRVESGGPGPDRKLYSLTARGRRILAAWLAQPALDRNESFVKLSLAIRSGLATASLAEAQREAWETDLAVKRDAARTAREAGDAGQLVLADAARRDSEAALAALALWEAAASPRRRDFAGHPASPPLIITGSDDPLLTRLAQAAQLSTRPVGSLGGLLALSQRRADVAGIHLLDADTGEYNVPFVRHLLPEEDIVLVNLATRENGLLLASGNPMNIRGLRDLARRGVHFINRERGTGTRLLLYSRLRAAKIDPNGIAHWNRVAATHDAVAAAVATGAADVGPGLRAVAEEWGLDFIPLGEERYDLAFPSVELDTPRLARLLETLHGAELRRAAASLKGYDLSRTGQIVARVS